MKEDAAYGAEILDEYLRIANENSSQKISFFRKNEILLSKIPLNEKLAIVLDFQIALFENGHFHEYLERCDDIVNSLFDSKLFPTFRKKDVQKLLFHKAGSQLNLHRLEESENTMKILVKMDEENSKLYKNLLYQIFKSKRLLLKFQARGIVIALILCSAILSIWTALVIEPLYPESVLRFRAWTIGMFSLGIFIWMGFILYNNLMSMRKAKDFVEKCS